MPLATWKQTSSIYARIIRGEVKLVGWGAGSAFQTHHAGFPLPLAYLVDSDAAKWGTSILGVTVSPPERLADEEPENTVIIVYSYFFFGAEISKKIEEIGPFLYLAPLDFTKAIQKFDRIWRVLEQPLPAGVRNGNAAILVQGPFVAGNTVTALSYYRRIYPDAPIVFSSWEGTPPDQLAEIEPLCDEIVLSSPPAVGGHMNINYQSVSTLAGLGSAVVQRVERVLKLRSDLVILRPDALSVFNQLSRLAPPRDRLRARIVLTPLFTYQHIPYHISDLVLFGHPEDLGRVFTHPPDNRDSRSYRVYLDMSLRDYARSEGVPEISYGANLARALGYELDYTTAQHWDMLKHYTVVASNSFFGYHWSKYGDGALVGRVDGYNLVAPADFPFWLQLQNSEAPWHDIPHYDLDKVSVRDFFPASIDWYDRFLKSNHEPSACLQMEERNVLR